MRSCLLQKERRCFLMKQLLQSQEKTSFWHPLSRLKCRKCDMVVLRLGTTMQKGEQKPREVWWGRHWGWEEPAADCGGAGVWCPGAEEARVLLGRGASSSVPRPPSCSSSSPQLRRSMLKALSWIIILRCCARHSARERHQRHENRGWWDSTCLEPPDGSEGLSYWENVQLLVCTFWGITVPLSGWSGETLVPSGKHFLNGNRAHG